MRVVDLVIGLGWVAFWCYWLISAGGAKPGRSPWLRFAGVRVALIVIVIVLLRLKVLRGRNEITHEPVLWGVGLALFALGLGLAVWARIYLGRNWGMPMSTKADPELVTTGPYQTIRHPIYTGMILAMVGTALAVSLYWLIAVALLGSYFIYSAVVEERNMSRLFPDSYPEYKKSTKMLLPYIL